jgi:hypothetical protein
MPKNGEGEGVREKWGTETQMSGHPTNQELGAS